MAGGAGVRKMVGSGNPHAAFDAGETFGITVFLDDPC